MKVISIVGPTAVGKTEFALSLARQAIEHQKYSGVDLISADSRQVYKDLEVVSGADVPQDLPKEITLHGVSIITPDQDWSVSHFQQYAQPIIDYALENNRVPIVVGGTGLYHDRLFETDPQLHIGPNEEVRTKAESMSVEQLQQWLQEIDVEKFAAMNNSDQSNPRRLIRAIEVALDKTATRDPDARQARPEFAHHIYLGITDNLDSIERRIQQRVMTRFEQGAIEEVQHLIEQYPDWSLPAFSATGVKELKQFLDGEITQDQCLAAWTLREFQYAKRQLTWWRAKSVRWYDITDKNRYTSAYVEFL